MILLRKAGLGVAMVTGDNPTTAQAVAATTGIETVQAQVTPLEKAAEVRLREGEGMHVLMAGDGINDAPALGRRRWEWRWAGQRTLLFS